MSQFTLVVGFVFDEGGNVLLLKRKDRQTWEPVKGGVEHGENPEEGIRRELLEETGVRKEEIVSFQSHGVVSQVETGDTLVAYFTFIVKGIEPLIQINYILEGGEDHQSYGWFSLETIQGIPLDSLSASLTRQMLAERDKTTS